ncbi:MAG TPA: DUF1646 family protein [Candidatus Methanoperedens sp.]|nr:DUF1646 family protein [Candidatus Methanoperedens sp.]
MIAELLSDYITQFISSIGYLAVLIAGLIFHYGRASLKGLHINAALMGLLIAGVMLIPGNIPNIISANKLGITSKEWAKLGLPLGAVIMVVYYIILFGFYSQFSISMNL